jgi:transposase
MLVLDQAGWHISKALPVPPNITLVPLPAKSPELNPVENIWQFMRDNWLSNRVFRSYEDILDHCCFAWNKLIDQPWKICQSALVNGHIGYHQRNLVLASLRRLSVPAFASD